MDELFPTLSAGFGLTIVFQLFSSEGGSEYQTDQSCQKSRKEVDRTNAKKFPVDELTKPVAEEEGKVRRQEMES
jgi:hypothetical protein